MIKQNKSGRFNLEIDLHDLDHLYEMQKALIDILQAAGSVDEELRPNGFSNNLVLEILRDTLINPADIDFIGRDEKYSRKFHSNGINDPAENEESEIASEIRKMKIENQTLYSAIGEIKKGMEIKSKKNGIKTTTHKDHTRLVGEPA
jgi:hypothetical protein